jgi:hypothetical protein
VSVAAADPRTGSFAPATPAVWKRLRAWWPIWLVIVLQLVFLWSTLGTDYVADDQINSNFRGGVGFMHTSFWSLANHYSSSFWTDAGRFFPISFFQGYGLMYLVPDIRAYKAIELALTIFSSISVAVLLRSLQVSVVRTALALLLATATFQLRIGSDGIMAFTGLMQSVVIETALSLACFSRFLRTGSKWGLFGAVVLFAICCLTYESAYVLSALHLLVAIAYKRPAIRRSRDALMQWVRTVIAAGPFLLITLIMLVVASIGRHQAAAGATNAYGVKLGIGDVARTLGEQLFGGLPLSYVLKAPGDVPWLPHRALLTHMSAWALGVGIAFAIAGWWMLRRETARGVAPEPLRGLTLIGGMLGGVATWFLAAAPIALAARYQLELRWGTAHIPAFIEAYGVGLALACLGIWIIRRLPGRAVSAITILAAVLLGLTASMTWGANHKVTDGLHAGREGRFTLQRSLDHGLLDGVPENADIFDGVSPPSWPLGPFYYQHTGDRSFPRLVSRPIGDFDLSLQRHRTPCSAAPTGAYWIFAQFADPDVETITCAGPPTQHGRNGLPSDRAYVRRADTSSGPFLVTGAWVGPRAGVAGKTFAKLSTELGAKKAGDGWMFALPFNGTTISPGSVGVHDRPDPGVPVWGGACSAPLGVVELTCQADGTATLVNNAKFARQMTLHATLQPGKKAQRWTVDGKDYKVLPGRPVAVTVTKTVAPKTTQELTVQVPKGGGVIRDAGVQASGNGG